MSQVGRHRGELRVTTLGVLALSFVALLGPGAISTARADAAGGQPLVESEVTGSPVKVVSSTGKKLLLTPVLDQYNDGGLITDFELTVSSRSRAEQHMWGLPIPASDFSVSDSGHGALAAPTSAIAPFGQVKLKISPRAASNTVACGTASSLTTEKLTLKGTVYFDTKSTGSKRWGTIGTKRKPLHVTSNATFVALHGTGQDIQSCFSSGQAACADSVYFSTGSDDGVGALSGGYIVVKGKKHGYVEGTRTTTLAKPANAFRKDLVKVPAPLPTLTITAPQTILKVTTSGHVASGAGTISSPDAPTDYPQPCGANGTETLSHWNASWSNGSKPLKVRADVFGSFAAANSTTGNLERYVASS